MSATAIAPMIEIRGLRKSFGSVAVLRGVDLAVPAGTVFALLGSNGAGKTTLVRILSTLLRADAGTATVGGHAVDTAAARVRETISRGCGSGAPPAAGRLPDLLRERGWTGWTRMQRTGS